MTNPKAGWLRMGKRWVRILDATKIRFRQNGREGSIDGQTEL